MPKIVGLLRLNIESKRVLTCDKGRYHTPSAPSSLTANKQTEAGHFRVMAVRTWQKVSKKACTITQPPADKVLEIMALAE